jgi:hypothetical protein
LADDGEDRSHVGTVGRGQRTSVAGHRTFPFKDYVSGQTADELAEDSKAKTGLQPKRVDRGLVDPSGGQSRLATAASALLRTDSSDPDSQCRERRARRGYVARPCGPFLLLRAV